MKIRRLISTVGLISVALAPIFGASAHAAAISDCFKIRSWPAKPVERDVKSAVTSYFQKKNQLPISIAKNQEQVIDVKIWSIGKHQCSLGGGAFGEYVGSIPSGATAAVQLNVTHKPGVGSPNGASVVVLAKIAKSGWTVLSVS